MPQRSGLCKQRHPSLRLRFSRPERKLREHCLFVGENPEKRDAPLLADALPENGWFC